MPNLQRYRRILRAIHRGRFASDEARIRSMLDRALTRVRARMLAEWRAETERDLAERQIGSPLGADRVKPAF
jgi:hypothetical protein